MKNGRTMSLGQIMGANAPSASASGVTKVAQQAQASEIFETLTKEAKEDIVGTMGWAGGMFGQQLRAQLEPVVEKLASLVAEMKIAASHGGLPAGGDRPVNAPGATGTNGDNDPGKSGWPTEKARAAFAKETVTEGRPAGSGGANFAGEENSGAAKPQPAPKPSEKNSADRSDVVARLRGGNKGKGKGACSKCESESCSCDESSKEAALVQAGLEFDALLKADLARAANGQ